MMMMMMMMMVMMFLHISVRSSMLFDLWNAFENRLPADFLEAKILEVGDLLFSIQVFHCIMCNQTNWVYYL